MLQLKNIIKTYVTGELTQDALKNVNISFRENEFVSILGPSGSGKTTMLNIIGGLDRYDSGDLIINGTSTKEYKDSDWDYYRNNSIGFVFQSYNLIPHQSVLSNVELALTLAGVSKKERKQRAITVLEKVGLKDHIHKRPNQLSGGQMQRVAIARALINNPEILLADEPTGALDSETSLQIMELLKEIAKDKLVIMVTHNAELAEKYSTRIVKLLDGKITSDTNPFMEEGMAEKQTIRKKISMSFFTALSLSFNNLRTKKGRTILTAFAGSIGIIGIALILSLSTGMNRYIADVQKDTMASYPITISAEAIDMNRLMGIRGERAGTAEDENNGERNRVYADHRDLEASEKISSSIVKNNLTAFKKYLDDPNSEIHQYIGENGVVYSYNVSFSVYSYNADGKLISSNTDLPSKTSGTFGNTSRNSGFTFSFGGAYGDSSNEAENFSEMMAGSKGETISRLVTESYEILYGRWPTDYNEVILVLNENNGISIGNLYQLGLITRNQYNTAVEKIKKGEKADEISFTYEDICNHTFYLVPACDHYIENTDGTFSQIEGSTLSDDILIENAIELKITGIIRPVKDADNANIKTTVAYTSKLTDYIIKRTNESAIIKAQEESPEINVLNGMRFETVDNASKVEDAKKYIRSMGISEKASLYKIMMFYSMSNTDNVAENNQGVASQIAEGMTMDETTMAAIMDKWLDNEPDEKILLTFYDEYIAGSTYEDNMKAFGKVSYDSPASISIYTDSFEDKDAIAACIERYNETADEEDKITYTDYIALLTTSLTTIINSISYVLVAFVAISLIVSSIMIGIITHISVMERTKEIGILRALGASKRNISQVFNAETFIIGCFAGLIGIGVSLFALIPINAIIQSLTGITDLSAQLPFGSSVILIVISILITILGGLLPAKKAAKKDPVIALRTE